MLGEKDLLSDMNLPGKHELLTEPFFNYSTYLSSPLKPPDAILRHDSNVGSKQCPGCFTRGRGPAKQYCHTQLRLIKPPPCAGSSLVVLSQHTDSSNLLLTRYQQQPEVQQASQTISQTTERAPGTNVVVWSSTASYSIACAGPGQKGDRGLVSVSADGMLIGVLAANPGTHVFHMMRLVLPWPTVYAADC